MNKNFTFRTAIILTAFVLPSLSGEGLGGEVSAQQFLNQPNLQNRAAEKKVTFWEVQKAFENYWKDKECGATEGENAGEGGYEQFKRWEAFMKQRTFPSGNFPSPEILFSEYQKYKSAGGVIKKAFTRQPLIGHSLVQVCFRETEAAQDNGLTAWHLILEILILFGLALPVAACGSQPMAEQRGQLPILIYYHPSAFPILQLTLQILKSCISQLAKIVWLTSPMIILFLFLLKEDIF